MRWKSIPAHFFICSPRIIAASLLVSKLSASAPGFVRYSGVCASLRSAPSIPERGAGGTRRKTWAAPSEGDRPNPQLLPRPCVALGGRGMAPHRGPLPRAPGLRGRSPPLRRADPPRGWFAAPSACNPALRRLRRVPGCAPLRRSRLPRGSPPARLALLASLAPSPRAGAGSPPAGGSPGALFAPARVARFPAAVKVIQRRRTCADLDRRHHRAEWQTSREGRFCHLSRLFLKVGLYVKREKDHPPAPPVGGGRRVKVYCGRASPPFVASGLPADQPLRKVRLQLHPYGSKVPAPF